MTITEQSWGTTPEGEIVSLYTVTSPTGAVLKMTNYGARIVAIEVPDRDGRLANVMLGFDRLEEYANHTAYFGCTVGRYAGRITGGKFTLNDKQHQLAINNGPNHLHGGAKGFDRRVWQAKTSEDAENGSIEFTYVSPDGEEGYPGTLTVTAKYTLTSGNDFRIDYTATTDQDTVLNLTNHAYWNLAGVGKKDVLGHELTIVADKYLEMDENLTSTGKLSNVSETVFDFRDSRTIGERIGTLTNTRTKGYDLAYALRNQDGTLALAARLKDLGTGRVMEIWTDQPGLVLYTANYLVGSPINGGYQQHSAVCLETEHYPDTPNHPSFPSTVLKRGETFHSTTIHKFRTE